MNYDLSRIRQEIDGLLKLEELHGHIGLKYNLDSYDEIVEKYIFILDLFTSVSRDDSPKIEDAKRMIIDMIVSGIITSEAAAYILVWHFFGNTELIELIEGVYKDVSIVDHEVFCGIYYRQLLISYKENWKKNDTRARIVAQKYIDRYSASSNPIWFSGKGAVYTVITGKYDNLLEPEFIDDNWDYYCYTDNPEAICSSVWKKIQIQSDESSPILKQKQLKFKPYEYLSDYDYTIYVDGSILINGDIRSLINGYSRGCSMLCMPHPTRFTLREEAEAIISLGKAESDKVYEQIKSYYDQGYKDDTVLISGGFLVRSNKDDKLNRVMDDWWKENLTYTTRDQLSFGYCCWKNDYEFDVMNIDICNNEYIQLNNHN